MATRQQPRCSSRFRNGGFLHITGRCHRRISVPVPSYHTDHQRPSWRIVRPHFHQMPFHSFLNREYRKVERKVSDHENILFEFYRTLLISYPLGESCSRQAYLRTCFCVYSPPRYGTRRSHFEMENPMKKLLSCLACPLLFFVASAPLSFAQFETFGGYSYLRANPGNNRMAENANGWEASLSAKLIGPLGVEADFSNHYGISVSSFSPAPPPTPPFAGSYVPGFTELYGPRYTIHSFPRAEPFVHALFGTVHGTAEETLPSPIAVVCPVSGCPTYTIAQRQAAFAMALGVGLIVKATHHVWVRLMQVDYMRAQFSGSPENDVRISAGPVLRFGRW